MTGIQKAAKIINDSEVLLIVAGAGMGVDSGLPDFRGSDGLYKSYPPFSKLGAGYMEMINPNCFFSNPALAWGLWGYQLNLYRKTIPHQGFAILADIAERKSNNYFVQTTNIDGQFQKAGYEIRKIHECHGSIHRLQCLHPCTEKVWSAEDIEVVIDKETMCMKSLLPLCPDCGAVARPNVFMFGDTKYIWDFPKGHADRYQDWLHQNRERYIAVVECGCGTVSPGLRNHSEEIIRKYSCAKLVRINLKEAEIPDNDNCVSIQMSVLEALRQISSLI